LMATATTAVSAATKRPSAPGRLVAAAEASVAEAMAPAAVSNPHLVVSVMVGVVREVLNSVILGRGPRRSRGQSEKLDKRPGCHLKTRRRSLVAVEVAIVAAIVTTAVGAAGTMTGVIGAMTGEIGRIDFSSNGRVVRLQQGPNKVLRGAWGDRV